MSTEADATVPDENYAFVLNVWHLLGQDTFEIAPGHILRRATSTERGVIRAAMERTQSFFPHGRTIWQIQWPHTEGPFVALPEEEWRYFVIAFRGSNQTLARIQEAFDLAPLELEVGFTILAEQSPGLGITYHPGRLFHVLEDVSPARPDFFTDVSAADVEVIRRTREKLEEHDHDLVDLRRLIAQLRSLKALQRHSPLRFLGYFAVLEELLTHAPKPTDPYESITRQVRKKVALLDNRWYIHLDYGPFRDAAPDTVWTKMYSYRSLLAHGGAAEFTGQLATLGNHENALKLVKDCVKAVMRQALEEPQLLRDLREC